MLRNASLQDLNPFGKIISLGGLFLFHLILFSLLSGSIAMAIYGIDIIELQDLLNNRTHPLFSPVMKVIQAGYTFGGFVLSALMAAKLFGNDLKSYLYMTKLDLRLFFLGGLFMLLTMPFISLLSEWNNAIHFPEFLKELEINFRNAEESQAALLKQFLDMPDWVSFTVNVFVIAILPAIGEELAFRGILQRQLVIITKNIHVGIWLTAFFFSAFHGSFFAFLPRFIMGGTFGYLFVWTRSIWVPIFAHFVNNSMTVFLIYRYGFDEIESIEQSMGNSSILIAGLLSMFIGTGIILYLKKSSNSTIRLEEFEDRNIR